MTQARKNCIKGLKVVYDARFTLKDFIADITQRDYKDHRVFFVETVKDLTIPIF